MTGLQRLPKDKRDKKYNLGLAFGVPAIPELPPEFFVAQPLEILNQIPNQSCTAFSGVAVGEDHEKIPLEPAWVYYNTKVRVLHDPEDIGANLRDAAKAICDYGYLTREESPIHLPQDSIQDVFNPVKWTGLDDKGKARGPSNFFWVHTGPYDMFDNIRAALFQHATELDTVQAGLEWRQDWVDTPGGVIPKTCSDTIIGGHCIKFFGWKTINGELYLALQNSWGTGRGDCGVYWLPRQALKDSNMRYYGALMYKKLTPEELKAVQVSFLDILKHYLKVVQYIIQYKLLGKHV